MTSDAPSLIGVLATHARRGRFWDCRCGEQDAPSMSHHQLAAIRAAAGSSPGAPFLVEGDERGALRPLTKVGAEDLARSFHENYLRLADRFG